VKLSNINIDENDNSKKKKINNLNQIELILFYICIDEYCVWVVNNFKADN